MESLTPRYCSEAPSAQTLLGIFEGLWKSSLPPELNLRTGSKDIFFRDPRVKWAAGKIDGGFKGLKILELGPFEGYDSYLFEKLGAASVVSIEANNINFLKCLVLKEALGMNVKYLFGDFRKYLAEKQRRFDLVWASGMLYHSDDPIDLLKGIARASDKVFIWTHYFSEHLMTGAQLSRFPDGPMQSPSDGTYAVYRRPYFGSTGSPIPLNWEGGTQHACYWMTRDAITGFLEANGYDIDIHEEGMLETGPYISCLAQRTSSESGKELSGQAGVRSDPSECLAQRVE